MHHQVYEELTLVGNSFKNTTITQSQFEYIIFAKLQKLLGLVILLTLVYIERRNGVQFPKHCMVPLFESVVRNVWALSTIISILMVNKCWTNFATKQKYRRRISLTFSMNGTLDSNGYFLHTELIFRVNISKHFQLVQMFYFGQFSKIEVVCF